MITLFFLIGHTIILQAQQKNKIRSSISPKAKWQKLEFTRASNPKDTIYYNGEVGNGKANGYGEASSSLRYNYKGYWKDNDLNGKGRIVWANGHVYEGEIKNGTRTGTGKYTWADGSVYEGNFINGQRSGKGKMTWGKNTQWGGESYEGDFKNNLLTGFGKYIHANGKSEEGFFENGIYKGKSNAPEQNQSNGKSKLDIGLETVILQNKGVEYYNKKQYELALQEFNKAIDVNPNYATSSHALVGRTYMAWYTESKDANYLKLALNSLSKAIELDSKYAPAYFYRGIVYGNLREYNLALKDLTQAIVLDPEVAEYYQNRSVIYKAIGEDKLSAFDLKKFEELRKKSEIK
ncbi:tetratricopeptide repeat protein [Pedobacter montanisoli]|uniref:Tetratricopeptide repeat protein n=1 Tax=Pedobacter montanisoli TaxID=2923277 RepID=A0ABS9ZUK9_9SPHI|nr:tetratricopeptide repeat protein [Pedobacter montanisoli]MCJ0741907.1 tetratricopeptide repeat protein [Pedobacter montanisoli]